jgi:hypothetical protein
MVNADFLNMPPERDQAMCEQPTEGTKAIHELCGTQKRDRTEEQVL